MSITLGIRYPVGTTGTDNDPQISGPTTPMSLEYITNISAVEMVADTNPRIIPSNKNGPLTNQSVAPRYFIMLISLERANTVSLMVLATMITDTIIRKIMVIIDAV